MRKTRNAMSWRGACGVMLAIGCSSGPTLEAEADETMALIEVTLVPSSLDLPPGLTADEFRTALEEASHRWSHPHVPCSRIAFRVAAAEPRRQVENDGKNLIVFRRRRWCHNQQCGPERTFPRLAAAMSTTYGSAPNVKVAEADVELNAVGFEWSIAAKPSQAGGRPLAPLVPVLVHEIGHLLGFPDACGSRHDGSVSADCAPAERQSVMVSGSGRDDLSDGDVERLCTRFQNETTRATQSPRGTSEGTSWKTLLAVGLVLLALWWVMRRRA